MELPKSRRTLAPTVGALGATRPAVLRPQRSVRRPPLLRAGMTGSLFKGNFWVSERGAGRARSPEHLGPDVTPRSHARKPKPKKEERPDPVVARSGVPRTWGDRDGACEQSLPGFSVRALPFLAAALSDFPRSPRGTPGTPAPLCENRELAVS